MTMHSGTNSVHAIARSLGEGRFVRGAGSLHGHSGRFTARVSRAILRLRPRWSELGEVGRLEVAWPCDKEPTRLESAIDWLRRKTLVSGVTFYVTGKEKIEHKEQWKSVVYELRDCSLVQMRRLASGTLTLCYVWGQMRRMSHLPRRTHQGLRLPEWLS